MAKHKLIVTAGLLLALVMLYWLWPGRYAMEAMPSLAEPFQATLQLAPGESTVLNLPYEYDTLLVVPPYTPTKSLQSLHLSWKLTRQVSANFTHHESYHFYVIKDGDLQGYALLQADFSTTNSGADLVRIDAPAQLEVTHQPNRHRPLEIGPAS
ncbi:hypothetical protein EV586_102141 [Tumebacillus sp. BK434]|uniref:hypothetical protein n=1 Tax=Tumebacillus sp. BK434 TaxID=2512169 RepID=UPI001047DC17|nr:hypothetical protein [Tumebacillus sp. BK434]TCP57697.1 hypothetical protein EV586_102141 [Tumebacillus sp. BK434]